MAKRLNNPGKAVIILRKNHVILEWWKVIKCNSSLQEGDETETQAVRLSMMQREFPWFPTVAKAARMSRALLSLFLLNCTLDKREEQVPDLIAARKSGKIAYFVLDKLIVKDKPPDSKKRNNPPASDDSEHEVSFNAQ